MVMASHKGYYSDLSNFVNVDQVLDQAELYRDQSGVSAGEAAVSAAAAAASRLDSQEDAAAALDSANAAATSASNSAISANESYGASQGAKASEQVAIQKAAEADASKTAAANSATASATSASNSAGSASAANTSASNASASATAASNSASASAGSASASQTSATNSASSATASANSASAAASSASDASTFRTQAGTSATNASNSASAAATSASNAASSATTASNAADRAEGAAASLNLPNAEGQGGRVLRQKYNETGLEYVNEIVSSIVDTTPNRLMIIGSHGYGGQAVPAGNTTNIQAVAQGRFNNIYRSETSALGIPSYCPRLATSASDTWWQMGVGHDSGRVYVAHGINSSWNGTKELWSDGTLGMVGAIMPFANATSPAGWLLCNGQAISRVAYAALFAAIGTNYGGGDGSTTFNLPDLRDNFIRGVGDGRAIGSFQAGSIESHTHAASSDLQGGHSHSFSGTTTVNGNHSHTYTDPTVGSDATTVGSGSGVAKYRVVTNGGTTVASGQHSHDFSGTTGAIGAHAHNITVNSTGGTETRPRNIALPYYIKF